MENNPFAMAVKAGLSKQASMKKYLMEVEGMTEAEADAHIAQTNNQSGDN